MKNRLYYILLFVSVIFLETPVLAAPIEQAQSPQKLLEQALSLEAGKVVYIDFWASWCGPCVKSFPWMNKIQQQYKTQGFTVISINLDADKEKAEDFLKKKTCIICRYL